MDTLNALVTVLGNGFFPICVCGVMFWYINKKDTEHKSEIDELRKSIEANTNVLQKFVDKFDIGKEN